LIMAGVDGAGWAIQTRLREIMEGIEWWLLQRLGSPNPAPQQSPDWNWLMAALVWLLRGLGLALLGLGLYLLNRFVWRSLTRRLGQLPIQGQQRSEPVRSRQDWLEVAQKAQAEQDYQKAFQALYRALLLLLNEAGLLLHDPARTDRESIQRLDQLWSLSDQPIAVRDDWVLLFETHEALCFGGSDLSRDRFLQCRAAFDQLMPYLPSRS
jgi:Domain of unknown function (DUF4129)